MSNTKVKFYRGCHGMGIVISVSYEEDRIIFDFGAPFNPLAEVYDGTVIERNENKTKDAIFLGRIPEVDGVFTRKDLQDLPIESYEESEFNTAIMICHLHLDHMSEIDKVCKDIPIYIHTDGLKMYEMINKMEHKTVDQNLIPFNYEEPFNIGKITITPFFSDHPCAGSASFLIQTPDCNVVYTGDIRYHGVNRELAFEQVNKMANESIDLLIIDSTTTSPSEFIMDEETKEEYDKASKDILPGSILEQDIYDDTFNSLEFFYGIGVFNMYPRDISMLENMYLLGNKLGRKTVYEPYYANILYTLKGIKPLVLLLDDEKDLILSDLRENVITLNDVVDNPNRYLLQNSYKHILNLISLEKIPGKYFHLLGEPLVSGTKEYDIMLNFINKLNWEFKTYINLYSFSHAYPNHLNYVVEKFNAKSVVAVHSKHPENLNPMNSLQFFPEEMKEYDLIDGQLK